MKVTFGDKSVIVKFWHGEFDMAPRKPSDPVRVVEGTECVLYTPGSKAEDSEIRDVAYCSPKDQFSKKTGRNLSLRRAVEVAARADAWGLGDEQVRATFWQNVNAQIGVPYVDPKPKKVKAPANLSEVAADLA